MRPRGKFSDGSATHGTKQRVPGDQFHAAEGEQGSPHHGGPRVLLGAHEAFGHLPQREQRSLTETGTDLLFNKLSVVELHVDIATLLIR